MSNSSALSDCDSLLLCLAIAKAKEEEGEAKARESRRGRSLESQQSEEKEKRKPSISSLKDRNCEKWSSSDLRGKKRLFSQAFNEVLKNKKVKNYFEKEENNSASTNRSIPSTDFQKGELFVCLS